MPPSVKFSRTTIIEACLRIIREQGSDAITARNIGISVGSSPRPIFTAFKNMDDMIDQTRGVAFRQFISYVSDFSRDEYYIEHFIHRLVAYSKNEPNMFTFLFTKGITQSILCTYPEMSEIRPTFVNQIKTNFNLSDQKANFVFEHFWISAFGMCSMMANGVIEYTDDQAITFVQNTFEAMLRLVETK